MRAKKEIIKFQDDDPVSVKFQFDSPLESNGRFGKQFCYGIVDGVGREKVIFVTDKLNNLLQTIGDLKGRQLEIERKVTDGGKNYWIIREDSEDITPSDGDAKAYLESIGKKDKIEEDVADLKMRVYEIEKALKGFNGGIF